MWLAASAEAGFLAPRPSADAGKTAWYIFRAVNAKGEGGPQSDQISGTIAA